MGSGACRGRWECRDGRMAGHRDVVSKGSVRGSRRVTKKVQPHELGFSRDIGSPGDPDNVCLFVFPKQGLRGHKLDEIPAWIFV